MSIAENVQTVEQRILRAAQKAGRDAGEITLLPVTKSVDVESVQALFEVGCRSFGENRIEVLNAKKDSFPTDVHWHFIGTLQRKKIRKVLSSSRILHGVESVALAEKISQVAQDMDMTVQIFLEVNTGEQQKGGFNPAELAHELEAIASLKNIEILGLMTMAPLTDNPEVIRQAFEKTAALKEELNALNVLPKPMKELSMGMSNDFEIAIAEGSTLVRVGTALYT